MRRLLPLLLLLAAAPALAAPPPEEAPPFTRQGDPASFDVLGGGSPVGAWAVGISGGWPWSSLRAQVGLPKGFTPLLSLETAVFRRWEPSLGLNGRILDRPRGRVSGEILLGWMIETGEVPRNGPRALARVRVLGLLGRVAPWFSLATGHVLTFADTTVVTATGESTERAVLHEWAPVIEAGVAVALHKHVGLELGFDWHLVGAPERFALPGLHLGVQFGAGPRPARWGEP